MAKFELEVEHDYEFFLLGIASHLPDYRLCWSINRALELELTRSEKPIRILQKDKVTYDAFDVFCFVNPENNIEYFLIDNIKDGIRLLPELKQADYLFMIREGNMTLHSEIKTKISEIAQVLTTFPIVVHDLKSKEKLLF